ncbi:MAG: endo alpha-1,4 polygalactosaminidase, partial [Phycisphaerales bacterium]|nr:endo alpha-1,4 polygalactosaminidase [Phycisphaerales bacterium]
IIDAGFDGVYLDIVDAYYFWSTSDDGGIPELPRMSARSLMIDMVEDLANYARITRGVSDFLVFPQNAQDIIRDDNDNLDAETTRYFDAIDGIGNEDVYYNELSPQPPAETNYVLDQLVEFRGAGKTILVTDYVIRPANPGPAENDARVAAFYSACRAEGFVPYAAHRNRDLNEIVTFSGTGWTYPQPTPGCPDGMGDTPGDADGDGDVDFDDLNLVLSQWGTAGPAGDVDADGDVDFDDLNEVLGNWGG